MKPADRWSYRKMLLEDGEDKELLQNWSDDKEEVLGDMDEEFDYMWNITPDGKLYFIDRLYSAYKNDPKTYAEYEKDESLMERIERNEAEMWFDSFDEVRAWMQKRR